MKIGFIINDLNSMNLEKDTSVYLMKEAHARGDDVFAFDSKDVTHIATSLYFPNPSELNFVIDGSESIEVKEFDFVINRLNPPFNKEYLYLTQMLEISGVDCINPAKALRENNEKLMILNFPEIIPFTVVTNSLEEIERVFENSKIEYMTSEQFLNSKKRKIWILCLPDVVFDRCKKLNSSSYYKILKREKVPGIKLILVEKLI